jgi:hypothetical protein
MVGQNIGKYRVLDRVGRGGMGTVYRAIDETLHREVAIKVLNAELNDPEVARRFRAEAITVARLSHPGIATIYELFQHDGQWLMVMEFVRGDTLEQLIARGGPLPADRAAALCMQSLAALAHAHSMGVVHRDLKPANIMLTEVGDVKIMDFGIARVSGTEHLTSVGFMMGTPAYMAPEQVLGQDIDARADIYAMGVVLFRLLSGQLPFKGDTPFAMAQAQVNAAPTAIGTLRDDLPAWVEGVVMRSLEKQPSDRYQSAAEFHETLERSLSGSGAPASYSSAAATGLIATPSRAQRTGEFERTMMSATPPAMPSGSVEIPAPATPPADTADFAPTMATATPVALERPRKPAVTIPVVTEAVIAPSRDAGMPSPTAAVEATADVAPASSRTPLIAGAAAAALLVVAGGWWAFSNRSAAPVEAPVVVEAPASAPTPVPAPAVPTPPPPAVAATPTPTGPVAGAAATPGGTAAAASASGAASSTPPTAAARGAGPGRRGAAPPVDTAPPVEVPNVRVMVIDGRRATDREATLTFANGRITAALRADGSTMVDWPYTSVASATYVHARSPRWNSELAAPADDLDVGGVFRASRHWLALQNSSEFALLRLEDVNVIQVIRELEGRTGLTIRRSNPN